MAVIKVRQRRSRPGCDGAEAARLGWWDGRAMKMLWETVWQFLKMSKTDVPHDLVFPVVGVYSKTNENNIQFLPVIFHSSIIHKCQKWEQPNYPPTNEWNGLHLGRSSQLLQRQSSKGSWFEASSGKKVARPPSQWKSWMWQCSLVIPVTRETVGRRLVIWGWPQGRNSRPRSKNN
jgi:hypothetical protein